MALSHKERQDNHDLRVKNHRITLQITDNSAKYNYDLLLKPETYSLDRPARTTVTQTRGGAFIDDFGLGIGSLSISGTTGFGQSKNNSPYYNSTSPTPLETVDGFDRWKGLVAFFEDFYRKKEAEDGNQWWMHFYNWSERDWFLVYPVGLPKLTRSVREPLLFRYEIQLTVLDQLNKTSYNRKGLSGDTLADLGVRDDRAPNIGLRIEEQLDNQAQVICQILSNQDANNFNPDDPDIGTKEMLDSLAAADRDAISQSFIDDVIRRQAPASYKVPLDSSKGTVSRTRAIADKIKDYSQGKTARIDTTIGEVQAAVQGWRDVLDAAEYAVNLPVVYAREVKETLCAAQSLLLYPQLFVNSVSAALTELADLLLDSGCATTLRR